MKPAISNFFFFLKTSFLPDSKPKLMERPNVSFADVKGCDEATKELEVIVKYLQDPESYGRLGTRGKPITDRI